MINFLASLLILALPTVSCTDGAAPSSYPAYAILVSPRSVAAGSTFHVMIAFEEPDPDVKVEMDDPQGILIPLTTRTGGGPPFWRAVTASAGKPGEYRVFLKKAGTRLASKSFVVTAAVQPKKPSRYIWDSEQGWDRNMENLYSVWLERLFMDAEEGATWNPLHEVTRDPDKNILHNHLGLGEDDQDGITSLVMEPDCADNPFFLRAYFAWKLGLPNGNHECSRGGLGQPPRCDRWTSNQTLRKAEATPLQAFQEHLYSIKNIVHSGSTRTSSQSEISDLYPLPLARTHLRPGTVFADPHGHTLTIVRWISQTEKQSGLLLAVDAQPDGTIGLKRFWRGSFFFTTADVIGDPGFKAFRPIVLENGKNRLLVNSEISASRDYGSYSQEQKGMAQHTFYDTMERLINPLPLDPIQAFSELHEAVHKQLLARVTAVSNGEKYIKTANYRVIPMPSGPRIFQTTGLWENFSTPARDLRLLVALDILLDFPDKVVRNPEAFHLPQDREPANLRSELQELHVRLSRETSITYTRSNGEEQDLTMEEVIERMEALEMAYNPNDCVEVRWGAPEGSREYSFCQRRAPHEQQNKMGEYRAWFRKRMIPIR